MRTLSVLPFALLLGGCGHDYTDIASSSSRDTSPSTADVTELTTGEASFGFDLYRAQVGADSSSNVFFSPYSISVALAMTYAGTGGNTASQIAAALHFTLPPDRLHTAFDAVDLALASRQGLKLNVASSVWGLSTLAYGKSFLDTLAVDYGSEVRGVDFIHAPVQATNAINGWVADQTNGKIVNLFPQGALDDSTRVVLVNAVYFDAHWKSSFDSGKTSPAAFTKLDGGSLSVPTMNGTMDVNSAQAGTYLAVEFPYTGEQTSMLVVMPTGGQFSSVEASLSGDFLAGVIHALTPIHTPVTLPKVTIKGSTVSMKAALGTLGVVDAFDPAKADLSPMVTSEPLFVHDVVHQAYVAIDENGTEAAAATGVSNDTAAVIEPLQINRPFFFFIRDIPTGAVLFVGRVMDPTATTL